MPHQLLTTPDWISAETWLLNHVSDHLRRDPISSIRVLAPSTTLTRHLEERLLASGVEGFFGRIFTTLSALIRELLEASQDANRPVLVPRALRLWAISHLVQQEIGDGGPLSRIRNYPGFVAAADQLIQELEEAGIDPETLAAVGRQRSSRKLQELGRIYAGYRRMLHDHDWTDDPLQMRAAAEAIRGLPDVQKFNPLIIYGLEDFTPIRLTLVRSLVETHGNCTFLVPFDPRRREAFTTAASDLDRLQDLMGAMPTSLQEPPIAQTTLDHVRREVFSPAPPRVNPDDSLQTLSASGPAQMIEAIARELRRLRRDDPTLKWKDCAVVFRSLSPYRRLIREIFPRFGIPFDLPTGTPWNEIAVLKLLRRLLDLKTNGFETETFLTCLKAASCQAEVDASDLQALAPLLPAQAPPRTVAAELHRFASREARQLEDPNEDRESSSSHRQRIAGLYEAADRLASFDKLAALPDRASLREYSGKVKELADSLIRIPHLDGEGDLPPDVGLIARDRRALAEFDDRLRGLACLWQDEVTFDEFLTLIDFLMEEEAVRESFPRIDCVAFHDPLALRGMSFRIVLLAGLQEKEFPISIHLRPFLNGEERRALEAQTGAGARLPSIPDGAARERLLFISALEAARDRVYLAYTETDTQGSPTVVSAFVEEVRDLIGDDGASGPISAAAYTMAHVLPDRPEHLWHPEEACAWGLHAAYSREPLTPDIASVLSVFLDRGLASSGLAAEVTRWHSPDITAYDGDLGDHEGIAEAMALSWSDRPLSPSALDSFGKCPWQFFAGRVLQLEAPEEADVEISRMDRGRLFHRILERFYRSRWDPGSGCARPLSEGEETEALQEIHRIAEEEFARFEQDGSLGHPGAWAYQRQDLLKRLTWFVQSETQRFRKNPGLAPTHLEFSFGLEERPGVDPASTDNPLTLIHSGQKLRARGIIDRVDAFPDGRAVVIDYKTGSTASTYAQVVDGISSQVFLYLLAAEHLLSLKPDRGLYLMAGRPPGARGGLPEQGTLTCSDKAPRSQLAWPELRALVLGYLTAYASDISNAHFPLLPVSADPCRYCDFRGICRVDDGHLSQRGLPAMDRFARSAMRNSQDG